MLKETGSKEFPIWLLGDSNPRNWEKVLSGPLDPRHPARHNIWTPVLDTLQDEVFRKAGRRLETASLYVRNAIEDSKHKPAGNEENWAAPVVREARVLGSDLNSYRPVLLISFGAFAYEFARRATSRTPQRPHKYWGARRLGADFRKHIEQFDVTKTNVLPLLHVSIARGRFIQSHQEFCVRKGANYFEFAGKAIAEMLLTHALSPPIWVPSGDTVRG